MGVILEMQWLGLIIRFVVSALVLVVVSWLSPGFVVHGGFVGALIAALVIAVVAIDKAVTKGVLHKNAASRKKSRLSKRFNKIQG
jgi:uncharacterized membrane protein YvlD (DUF360 family)